MNNLPKIFKQFRKEQNAIIYNICYEKGISYNNTRMIISGIALKEIDILHDFTNKFRHDIKILRNTQIHFNIPRNLRIKCERIAYSKEFKKIFHLDRLSLENKISQEYWQITHSCFNT